MRSRLPTIALLASLVLGFGPAGTAGAAAPAGAAGAGYVAAVASGASSSLVEQAQYRDRDWRRDRREWRRDRREWRRDRREARREWRHHRRHWDNDWPRAGFYFHIEPRRYYHPRPVYRSTNAHYRWCERRYRSYRAWDNTFQPYHGPRQQCYSPYS